MDRAEKQQIHEFLAVEPVGKLFNRLAVEVIARNSDLRHLTGDPVVMKQAIELFTEWLNEIYGCQNDFLNEVDIENKRQKIIEESIYHN